jgi:hypothetical protein
VAQGEVITAYGMTAVIIQSAGAALPKDCQRVIACPRCYPLPRLRRPSEQCPSGGPMTDLATNVLYYGDNLDILRRYLIR